MTADPPLPPDPLVPRASPGPAGSTTAPARRDRARRADRLLAEAWGAADRALEPMLPAQCAVCGAPSQGLCRACTRLLHRSCSRPRRVESQAPRLEGLPTVAAGPYEFEVAACLLALKEGGRTDLLPPLARILAAAVRAAVGETPATTLVAVPSSAAALRRRWFDPVAELLRRCHRMGLLPEHVRVEPWLGHRSRRLRAAPGLLRPQTSQKARDARGRAAVLEPFVVQRPWSAARAGHAVPSIVLVDDVLTTGSTLVRAWRALESAGLPVRGAVVLAAVPAPSSDPPRRPGAREDGPT